MIYKRTLFVFVVVCHSTVFAHADEICSDKLLSPNIKTSWNDVRTFAYLHDAMCSMSYTKFSDTYGASTGAKYFEISGFGDFNYDKHRETKNSECREITTIQAASSLSYTSESVIPESARENYVDCIQKQPLVCNFSKDKGAPVLVVSYHHDGSGKATIRSSTPLTNAALVNDLLNPGSILPEGKTSVPATITDQSKATSGTINLEINDAAESCTAYISAPPPPPKVNYTFHIHGTVTHAGVIASAFTLDETTRYNDFQPTLGPWPQIAGIYDVDLGVDEFVNGQSCAIGAITGKSLTFNEPSGYTDSQVDYGEQFKGGMNVVASNTSLQFFFDPKVCKVHTE